MIDSVRLIRMSGAATLLYSTAFHVLAGALTGSVFRIRTLLMLLALVLAEAVAAGIIYGSVAVWWAVANLVGLQAGYFVGGLGRSMIERAAQSRADVHPRRLP